MSSTFGRQAVVIGAGMAGMPAARALSDYFDRVVVLENDALPSGASARSGTPQCKSLHALLAGGQVALCALFPGFEAQLVAAGAQLIRGATDERWELPGIGTYPQRDLGMRGYSLSRPLLESVLRHNVTAIRNIEFREQCRAQSLMTTDDGSTVTGVRYRNAAGELEELSADLVIDASSSGQVTLNLLEALALPAPEEAAIGLEMGYSTAIFEIPADAPTDWRMAVTISDPPNNRRGSVIVPIEGNCWIVSISGSHDVKPPEDEAGYFEFAQQLRTRTIYNAIRGARRVGPITRYGLKASRWRRFERLERFPGRLIPFGDTICRFNPRYGQGMSVAAKEAQLLMGLLEAAGSSSEGIDRLATDFLAQAQPIIDAPWAQAVVPDLRDPLTEGERPPDFEAGLKYGAGLQKLAVRDAEIHKLMFEVQQLLKPRSVLRTPEIAERVKAVMADA